MVDEPAYLEAMRREAAAPQHGAPDSLVLETAEFRDGRADRRMHVRWSFVPWDDDPRPRTEGGRIEGESSREIDSHPENDFQAPQSFADVLWDQAGLEATDLMLAAYDVAPSAPTAEHAARADALIPDRDEWWRQLLEHLAMFGTVTPEEGRVTLHERGGVDLVLAFGPDAWHDHLRRHTIDVLAAGTNLERREWDLQGYWDEVYETIGSSPSTVVRLTRDGLEPDPAYAHPPVGPPPPGGHWVAR